MLSGSVCGGWIFPAQRENFSLSVAISTCGNPWEDLDGFHQDLLRKMGVPLGHPQIGMAGELLDSTR